MRIWLTVLLWCVASGLANAAEPGEESQAVVDLGDGHYRIGAIEVDKNTHRFQVTGTVLQLESRSAPIEFIAVTKDGMKAYESLLELDTEAVEFNLACILIGLDADNATHPEYHFDPAEVRGDRVDLRVSWGGKDQNLPVEALLAGVADDATHDWVYTGSSFTANGVYLATMASSLIGFVHAPETIIQHRMGMGLGEYGAVIYDPEVMPPAGTRITLTVVRIAN